jgi:peptide/nickel transport system permease protein
VRLLRSRPVRKFVRNRLGMAALAIILLYTLIGALGILGDQALAHPRLRILPQVLRLISVKEAEQRIGPGTLRGLRLQSEPSKRLDQAMFYIDLAEKALKARDRDQAIADSALAERRLAPLTPDRTQEILDTALEAYDELSGADDLAAVDGLESKLQTIESAALELMPIPDGRAGALYRFRTLLGTDRQGRSILIRSLYSISVALKVGVIVGLFAVAFGSTLGAAAAFFRGWVDHAVQWLYSTFSSIPNLVLLALLVYMFTGSKVDGTLIPVYFALGATFWIGPCRVVRGEVFKIRELEYVQAATAIGFRRGYIVLRHILPNTIHLMLINFSLLFIAAIKSEVILTFLGLGVKKGASWGIMISQATQEVINGFFWQIGSATAFMFVLVLAFNIVSDALQDAFDPKHVG